MIVMIVAAVFWWVRFNAVQNPGRANLVNEQTKNSSIVYQGTLPCADCSGIETTLSLYRADDQPSKYEMVSVYTGKDAAPLTETGKWSILSGQGASRNEVIYQLLDDNGGNQMFLVSGDELRLLDADENVLPSSIPSVLKKVN